MGKENETQSGFSETTPLIDFLYVDEPRVDSLISQLRSGTLRSVTKTVGTSEGSFISGKGDIKIIGGKYEHKNTTAESAAENYDPFHNKIVQLMQDLSLSPQESIEGEFSGRLVTLLGKVRIRDIQSVKTFFPFIFKNQKLFGLNKTVAQMIKNISDFIQAMSNSIELSIELKNGVYVAGNLKESGLSVRQSDLARTYGAELPGKWYIMGILDYTPPQKNTPTQVDEQTIENIVDQYTDVIRTFYSKSTYSIIPILIFRTIG
nr:MAG TPA_asm: hypothetical protein [Caudoviricetes sp.]